MGHEFHGKLSFPLYTSGFFEFNGFFLCGVKSRDYLTAFASHSQKSRFGHYVFPFGGNPAYRKIKAQEVDNE